MARNTSNTSTANNTKVNAPAEFPDWLIIAPFVAIVLLQVVGSLVNDNNVWGFSLWSVFPQWAVFVALGCYLPLTIPAIALRVWAPLEFAFKTITKTTARIPGPILWSAASAGIAVVCWILRSRALIYGDGYEKVALSTRPLSDAFANVHEFIRPLTIALHAMSQIVASMFDSVAPLTTFSVVSVVGGVVGWIGLIMAARTLGKTFAERMIVFLVAMTSGCVMLLLGWVELNVWPTALLLWLLVAAVRYAQGLLPAWSVFVCASLAALANAFLIPVALIVAIMSIRFRGESPWALKVIPRPFHLFCIVTVAAVILGVLMNFTPLIDFIVPLSPNSECPYGFFSIQHLTDILNQAVFVAPVGGFFLVLFFVRVKTKIFDNPVVTLLGMASWVCLLIAIWIDPKFGAARDWDLLSFYGFPLSLLGGYLVISILTSERQLRLFLSLAMATAVFVLIPNIYEKTHASVSIERIDKLNWTDIRHQEGFLDAYCCIPFGGVLLNFGERADLAEKYFLRRIKAKPDSDVGWYNLGIVARDKGEDDRSVGCFRRAIALSPAIEKYKLALVATLQKQGKHQEVDRLLASIDTENNASVEVVRSRGVAMARQGRFNDALVMFRRAESMNPRSYPEKSNLGLIFSNLNMPDSALVYFIQGIPLCPSELKCNLYQAIIYEQIAARRKADAVRTLAEYQKLCPDATDVQLLKSKVAAMVGR